MLKTAGVAVVSVCLATIGQFLLKAGMDRVGVISADRIRKPFELAMTVAKTPQVVVGLAVFVVSAVFWLVVLSRLPLSTAYPFAGLTYLLTALIARFGLNESVPGMRWLGILLIVGGIVLVSRTTPGEPQTSVPIHDATSGQRVPVELHK
jgi:multidrug transporter EmrE-like cation transporter